MEGLQALLFKLRPDTAVSIYIDKLRLCRAVVRDGEGGSNTIVYHLLFTVSFSPCSIASNCLKKQKIGCCFASPGLREVLRMAYGRNNIAKGNALG
jgi:hypothetical protein